MGTGIFSKRYLNGRNLDIFGECFHGSVSGTDYTVCIQVRNMPSSA